MIKFVIPAALLLAMSLSMPALGETIEGAPPADDSTSCSGVCSAPNSNWTSETSGESATTTDTYVQTSTDEFNRAEEASGGRASDRNQSNFVETTTTTTVVEATTVEGQWVNRGGGSPNPKEFEQTTYNWVDQNSDSTTSHVKPSKPSKP